MAYTDFNDRLARIDAKKPAGVVASPAVEPADPPLASPPKPAFSGWKIFLAVLLGLILVPLSFAARVDTQVVLEPQFGPDAYYYFTAMSFSVGFHLLLLSLVIVALAHRFKRMMLNIVVLEMLIGYGLASLMFATIIQ